MGTRSLDSGAQALRELRQQGLKSDVELVELDVTEDDSIRIAVEFLHRKYGKIDGKFPRRFEEKFIFS